jgi:hypothetical protein
MGMSMCWIMRKNRTSPLMENGIYTIISRTSCFLEKDGFLYFGSSSDGLVYRFFKETNDAISYNDDGAAINAYWKSKPLTFEAEERYKLIDCIYIGLKPSGATSVDVSYETDKRKRDITTDNQLKFNLFDFNNFDFANLTFHYSPFPQEFKLKSKRKKITHFQLTITNNQLNQSLTVLSLVIKYTYQNFIK